MDHEVGANAPGVNATVSVLLAIDPSSKETGWAIFTRVSPLGGTHAGELVRFASPPYHGDVEIDPQTQSQGILLETGVLKSDYRRRSVDVAERIKAIEVKLDALANTWNPQELAYGKPSIMQLPQQREVVKMLTLVLERWAHERNLPLYSYPLRDIRAAILGRPNAAKEELAYAVMTRWGLLGTGKTTHEWTAIAVGDYHVGRHKVGAGIEN